MIRVCSRHSREAIVAGEAYVQGRRVKVSSERRQGLDHTGAVAKVRDLDFILGLWGNH